jgi:2-dehydropantoate 2-reductase
VRFLVYGTGAVGGYLGARLLQAGHRVEFVARPAWLHALQHQGLQLLNDGESTPVPAQDVVLGLREAVTNVDAVLLAVKAYDAAPAADRLADGLAPNIPVISLLNGIGSEQTLGSVLGLDRVIAGSLTTAVQTLEPGVIRIERERGLGLGAGHPLTASLAAAFRSAGIETRLYAVPQAMKWSKLLTNMVANASSAILGWTASAVMRHPGVFRLEIEALRETTSVMRRMGLKAVALPGVRVDALTWVLGLPAPGLQPLLSGVVSRGRGSKLPSFHGDIGRGRSEVDWLNGAVAEHGRRLGVVTPANMLLTEVLDGLVRGDVAPEAYRDRPDVLLERAARAGVPGTAGYNRPR